MQAPDYFHTSSELSSILGRLSIADQDPPPVDVHVLHDEERSVVRAGTAEVEADPSSPRMERTKKKEKSMNHKSFNDTPVYK
jgi:hypothetical protein